MKNGTIEKLDGIREQLALFGFKMGMPKIQPTDPVTMAQGWKSPMYYDNRRFLYHPHTRQLVTRGLALLVEHYIPAAKVIIGIPTAAIPWGYGLSDRLGLHYVYARSDKKDHGMRNQFEGLDEAQNFSGQKCVAVEDLITTGKSSVAIINAIQKAHGTVTDCVSIFSYEFPQALETFGGTASFTDNGSVLENPCTIHPILTYSYVLKIGVRYGFIKKNQEKFLAAWHADPEGWSKEYMMSR